MGVDWKREDGEDKDDKRQEVTLLTDILLEGLVDLLDGDDSVGGCDSVNHISL